MTRRPRRRPGSPAAAGLNADPLQLPLATGATVAAFLAWLKVVTRGLLRRA